MALVPKNDAFCSLVLVPLVSKSGTSGANAVKFMLLSCCNMAAMLPLVPEILPRTMYYVCFLLVPLVSFFLHYSSCRL
jgi:hypothetical protein